MDEKERLIYFYYERLQSIRRHQKRYLAWLLGLLGFVWVFYWNKPAGVSANLLGMPLSDKSLLGFTPVGSTVLLLGLIGSQRAFRPAFLLLKEAWKNAGGTARFESEEIDDQQNWVDYAGAVWARHLGAFIYLATFVAVIASTFAIGLTLDPQFKGYANFLFTTYCLICLGVEVAASWKWIAERVGRFR